MNKNNGNKLKGMLGYMRAAQEASTDGDFRAVVDGLFQFIAVYTKNDIGSSSCCQVG